MNVDKQVDKQVDESDIFSTKSFHGCIRVRQPKHVQCLHLIVELLASMKQQGDSRENARQKINIYLENQHISTIKYVSTC